MKTNELIIKQIIIGVILILLFIMIFMLCLLYKKKKPQKIKLIEIPMYIEARENMDYKQQIPKNIFQTMKTNKLPIQMKQSIDTWINLNPEYSYNFYDDKKCRTFIKNNFDNKVLNAYDKLIPGAYKADLWRYCVLYKYGGVYIDIDTITIKPLRDIIEPDDTFISSRDKNKDAIYNAFIASVPGHPFLYKMINYIIENIETNYYGNNSLEPTGPYGFGKVIKNMIGLNDIFPVGTFEMNNYKLKMLDFPINSKFIYYLNTPVFIYKYPEYTNNITKYKLSNDYNYLWNLGMIYA